MNHQSKDVHVAQPGSTCPNLNDRNSRTRCEICPKLTIKTRERRHCVFNVNLE